MSRESNRQRMLAERGRLYVEPNDLGGCASHVIRREAERYKLVLDSRYAPCDSISTWVEESNGVATARTHQWTTFDDPETEWYPVTVGYVIKEDKWSRLGPPSAKAMVKNFINSMAAAKAQGWKHTPENVIEQRLTCCRQCPYWREHARLGFGKCTHPGCGCTKAKLWVGSEQCPQGFWKSVT